MWLTKQISSSMILYWRAMPIFAFGLIWFFFTGFRSILRTGEQRWRREALLCGLALGIFLTALAFGAYGLVDPANGLARLRARPVPPGALERFEWMGYASLLLAVLSGIGLELSLRSRQK